VSSHDGDAQAPRLTLLFSRYFWSCQGEVMREQTGTFRINCIDCLDRTNVVESALARHVLTSQLTQVGMAPDALTSNIEFVYNDGRSASERGVPESSLHWSALTNSVGQ
jgi:hypothetical protein